MAIDDGFTNFGVAALRSMDKGHYDPGGKTPKSEINRLMNYRPEPNITHKRGAQVKLFPVND